MTLSTMAMYGWQTSTRYHWRRRDRSRMHTFPTFHGVFMSTAFLKAVQQVEAGSVRAILSQPLRGLPSAPWKNPNEIKNGYNAGDTAKITIYRGGENIDLNLTLQEVKQSN